VPTFASNNSSAIRIVGNSPSIIFNSIFYDNKIGIQANGQPVDVNGYNSFYQNNTNFDGITEGYGDIFTNPLFTDVSNNNYELLTNSPCINAGHDSLPDTDHTRSDIGAYGGLFSEWTKMFISRSNLIEGIVPYYIFGRDSLEISINPLTKSKTEITDTLIITLINQNLFLPVTSQTTKQMWELQSTNTISEKELIFSYNMNNVKNVNEKDLQLAYYSESDKEWQIQATEIDTLNHYLLTNKIDINGYWTIIVSHETDIKESNIEDNIFIISKIYPNPFASKLEIEINIPETMEYQIIITDISGKISETISTKTYNKGKQTITWNSPDNLKSGQYIITIQNSKYKESKNIILIK